MGECGFDRFSLAARKVAPLDFVHMDANSVKEESSEQRNSETIRQFDDLTTGQSNNLILIRIKH